MTSFVIAIILISACMHAGWNLIARYARSEINFYRQMLVVMILLGFIPAVGSEIAARSLTHTAWLCVLGSGMSAGLYLYFLGKSFESSDFSVVYPVARSLPVIFVAVIDVLRGRPLTLFGWLGILLVASGCILVPLQSFKDFAPRRYFNLASLWMLLTALGTVGYTLLDKIAAETVQSSPATAFRYGYFYFVISYVPLVGFIKLENMRKPAARSFLREEQPGMEGISEQAHFISSRTVPGIQAWKLPAVAAVLSFAAYWLILWAYQLSPYASYIVAFRQSSVVIGAVFAFWIFKEGGVAVRLTGALLITAGLVLIALLGR